MPVYVETFSGSFPLGILVNLSGEGMFVQSTEPKEVGTLMELRLTLPDSGQTIQVSTEVVWVNYPPDHPESQALAHPGAAVHDNPGMGLRIVAIDPRSRAALKSFLEDLTVVGTS